jgi:uncharacterized protein YyaL (SSP411 family)
MTVFMTAERKPFYAGTYFPPQDTGGRPGFPRLLRGIRDAWEHDREQLLESAEALTSRLQEAASHPETGEDLTTELASQAVERLRAAFDPTWGGFGGAPKFPSPTTLEFLLMHHSRAGVGGDQPGALEMTLHTLRRMASGGVYDQLGGGFARYSVDERWLVPHFEKMLYDNAQLVRIYVHAFQITGERFFERIARESLDYLQREMLDAEGGFYSAQDADSEGIEGKYFLWTAEQVHAVLGGEDTPLFNDYYGVTEGGNFTDPHHPHLTARNVLSVPRDLAEIAQERGVEIDALGARLAELRARMLAVRAKRVAPGLDDKVLTSWNGLAMAAFAEAARVFDDGGYREVAERNAAFMRERMWRQGRLLHSYRDGVGRIDGMLEDYAYYGLALIELFRAGGDLDHLRWASELMETIIARFHDEERGGFYDTAVDGERLLLRQQSLFDAATPSGNGAASLLALWLARYFDRDDWEQVGRRAVANAATNLALAPSGYGSIGQAVELLLAPRREVAIVGDAERRAPLERELARHFLPATAIVPSSGGEGLPVLEGRDAGDGAAAYVCENMVCQLPATTVVSLAERLRA